MADELSAMQWQQVLNGNPDAANKCYREMEEKGKELWLQAHSLWMDSLTNDDDKAFVLYISELSREQLELLSRYPDSETRENHPDFLKYLSEVILERIEQEFREVAVGGSKFPGEQTGGAGNVENAFRTIKKILNDHGIDLPPMAPGMGPNARDTRGLQGYRLWKANVVALGQELLDTGLQGKAAKAMHNSIEMMNMSAHNVSTSVNSLYKWAK